MFQPQLADPYIDHSSNGNYIIISGIITAFNDVVMAPIVDDV